MPKSILVGEKATATIAGLDQNGQPLALDSTYSVAYSASPNPASVSFGTVNPDGSVVVVGVAADTVSIGAVITRPDGGTVTATADTLTISAPPPPTPVLTSASVVLQ